MDAVLSLDIGGTKMAATVLTAAGDRITGRREPSRAREGPEAMIGRLVSMAREALAESGVTVTRAGISVGGPLDPVEGIILSPPNLPGWDRIPLRSRVAAELGLTPPRVHVENDANAGALAELNFGAGRGHRHFVFLTCSTGMGGGLILDGRLYRGASLNAGEVGHQVVVPGGPPCGCGGSGCLEAIASGSGIAARLRDMFDQLSPSMRRAAGSPERISAAHLFEAVRQGDATAGRIFDEVVEALARGISNLVFTLNPEMVILGTLAWHAGRLLLDPLNAAVRRDCWPVLTRDLQVVATPLGPRLEELAGLAVALEGAGAEPPAG